MCLVTLGRKFRLLHSASDCQQERRSSGLILCLPTTVGVLKASVWSTCGRISRVSKKSSAWTWSRLNETASSASKIQKVQPSG